MTTMMTMRRFVHLVVVESLLRWFSHNSDFSPFYTRVICIYHFAKHPLVPAPKLFFIALILYKSPDFKGT